MGCGALSHQRRKYELVTHDEETVRDEGQIIAPPHATKPPEAPRGEPQILQQGTHSQILQGPSHSQHAEIWEVEQVLSMGRRRRSELVEMAEVFRAAGRRSVSKIGEYVSYPGGSSVSGAEAWSSGRFLVMSGQACIRATCSDDKVETTIATLRAGNSFGSWNMPDDSSHASADMHTWESLSARIVVDESEPLRLCHIESPLLDDAMHIGAHHHHHQHHHHHYDHRILEVDELTEQFADLWLHTSAPPVGIGMQPSSCLRALYMTALWGPLMDRLEEHDDEIRRRKRQGYRPYDRFPLAGHQIAELRDHILHLTELWYGSEKGGNLSALYRWFMQTMTAIGVTAYSMDDIPCESTPDGWAVVVDGSTRTKALKNKGGQDASTQATGGLNQKQGRSAIDNTVLVNVFTAKEATVILVGRVLRKVICKFIALRQHWIIRKLSDCLRINLAAYASEDGTGRGHRLVRSILSACSPDELRAAGIHTDSFCFKLLQSRGSVLSGFGQLEPDDQKMVWEQASSLVIPGVNPNDIAPKMDSEDVFDRLVLWCREFPGEYFEKNKLRHFEVMLGGIWCDKVVLVKRSAMERMTMARYFALSWTRSQPLWAVFSTGAPHVLRESGSNEASRVRANECPYARLHGMSLPTGGFALDERRKRSKGKKDKSKKCSYSLMMEAQWVQDPAGNIENWFLTDIEKIVQEAWRLNPHGEKSMMLPGEMFVNVGQNPKIGSSIKQTQHTQLCEASLGSLPVLRVSSPTGPRRSEQLDALVDLVDIGPRDAPADGCGFFLKLFAAKPHEPALVQFLVELRLRLLAEFGGAETLDFLVTAVSDERGGFLVLFAPIPHLLKVGPEPPDLASWANPLTGESSESAGIAEARLDFGKGVGQFLCLKPSLRDQLNADGEDTLRRIWAFNRVPGVRESVQTFVQERRIFG